MLHLMHYLKIYKHALFILKHLIRTDIRTKKLRVSIRILSLILTELRSIAKSRHENGHENMPKNQLINLITKDGLSTTPRSTFIIEKCI